MSRQSSPDRSSARRSPAARPTDDELLDAARAVFAERGYAQATMGLIADRADSTKPTLYAHFGDKAALFRTTVRREVAAAVKSFLEPRGLRRDDVTQWILHPGGRRIIEVMSERLGLSAEDLAPTEAVLAEHGNMSSVTVLFVLDEILRRRRPRPGERGMLGAFGPGFGAEFALLEFL